MRFLLEWSGLSALAWAVGVLVFMGIVAPWDWVFTKPEYARMPMYVAIGLASPVEGLAFAVGFWLARKGPKKCRCMVPYFEPCGAVIEGGNWTSSAMCGRDTHLEACRRTECRSGAAAPDS